MQEEEFDNSLKVIVVGNGQVGKTSMITRFATGEFTGQYKKTIGTDFMERDLDIPSKGQSYKLMLWDTAGQEMFSEITRNYYRGAGAVVYAFSSIDRDSFDAVQKWRTRVHEECGDGLAEVLVQTKTDLIGQALMSPSEAEGLAKTLSLKLYRVCTKENKLVDDVFRYVTELSIEKTSSRAPAKPVKKPPPVKADAAPSKDGADMDDAARKDKFKLEPSRQRTGGKKKPFCSIV